ncbi:MAG: alpha/beta hydrolase [Caulobacter sp.]|nr:alpha/beta hydrolase [Caulobacter sp.]
MRSILKLAAVLGVLATPLGLASPAFAAEPVAAVRDLGRFTVEVRGTGPDVILIPGLASSREVWNATADQLAKTHRVHLVQLAGFAGLPAGPNAEGPMLDPIVADLHAYIVRERLGSPAIIGHSLGGLLGLNLAQDHPRDVGRLMVVDAVPFLSAMTNPAVTVETAGPGASAMRDRVLALSDADFATLQKNSAPYMTKAADWQPKVAAWTIATDRKVMAKAMYEDMMDDARVGLPGMKTPVTVLYAWDATMPYGAEAADGVYARNYQGLAGVKLVRVDGAYHFLMLDQPERFAAEVAAFLD